MLITRIVDRLREIVATVRANIEDVREHVHQEAERLENKIDKRRDQQLTEQLDGLAEQSSEKLDWRHSIVDFLKLIDVDSDLPFRRALAGELGFSGNFEGSPADNIWLHKAVFDAISQPPHSLPLPRD